nr:MAG TPA: Regulator of Ty1 transposition protein domain, mitosis, protein interaction.8A [Caudoviricetes sp.]
MLNFRGFSISLFDQFDHQFCVTDIILPVLDLIRPGFRFLDFYFCFLCTPDIKNRSNNT